MGREEKRGNYASKRKTIKKKNSLVHICCYAIFRKG